MKLRLHLRTNDVPVIEEKNGPTDAEASSVKTDGICDKEASVVTATESGEQGVTPDFQHGVQSAQAVNQVWTKRDLILAYAL